MTLDPISARDFLAGGGVLSLGEWMALDPDSRKAFVTAGREREERIVDMILEKIGATIGASMGAIRLEQLMKKAEEMVSP